MSLSTEEIDSNAWEAVRELLGLLWMRWNVVLTLLKIQTRGESGNTTQQEMGKIHEGYDK